MHMSGTIYSLHSVYVWDHTIKLRNGLCNKVVSTLPLYMVQLLFCVASSCITHLTLLQGWLFNEIKIYSPT